MNKKGGFEMSITTLVVIVIAVIMLILGLFLVRNIMCGAIGMTGDINDKMRGQIDEMFGGISSGEVQCIGGGSENVKMPADGVANIYCGFRPDKTTTYTYSIEVTGGEIPKETITSWIIAGSDKGTITVAPGDNEPKKLLYMRIPKDAQEGLILMTLKINGKSDVKLSYEVARMGFVQGAIC